MNPARTFGPMIVSRKWFNYEWIYFAGPFLGAIIAAGFYRLLNAMAYWTANPDQDSDGLKYYRIVPTLEEPPPTMPQRRGSRVSSVDKTEIQEVSFSPHLREYHPPRTHETRTQVRSVPSADSHHARRVPRPTSRAGSQSSTHATSGGDRGGDRGVYYNGNPFNS